MKRYFDDPKDKKLFIGTDLKGISYYVEIPDIFLPYKKNIGNSIDLVFYSRFSNIVHPSFIDNMKSRDVLHLFIQKYTLSFFESITMSEQLEFLLQEEFIKQFEIKEYDEEAKNAFNRCNKSVFIEAYLSRLYKTKLLDYKNRLDKVEL